MPLTSRNPLRPSASSLPQPAERIVLTGFMGSGKSTAGRLVAAELDWAFVDLDDMIERRTGLTVPQLFAQRGEETFRKEETAALAAALRLAHTVIALGGGAPETLSNRLLLEQTPATAVIFLSAPFDTLEARCAEQALDISLPTRPLFSDSQAAHARFAARGPLYKRLAHVTVQTAGQSPQQTASEVIAIIAPQVAASVGCGHRVPPGAHRIETLARYFAARVGADR